jgi:hypothetical protein
MAVRAHYLISALLASVALGAGSHNSGSETLQPANAVRVAVSFDRPSATRRPVVTPALSTRKGTNVASETLRLDLSKLTMADFGDVEASR